MLEKIKPAPMMELVYMRDLKSLGRFPIRVRISLGAFLDITHIWVS